MCVLGWLLETSEVKRGYNMVWVLRSSFLVLRKEREDSNLDCVYTHA